MATTIANLAVLLTANTSGFSGKMAVAATSIEPVSRAVGRLHRLAKVTFGLVALRGLVGQIRTAAGVAREFNIRVGEINQARLDGLAGDFNVFRASVARTTLLIGAQLAPQLGRLLEGLSRISFTVASVLTPGVIQSLVVTGKWVLSIFLAAKAYWVVISVIKALTKIQVAWGIVQALVFRGALAGAKAYIAAQTVIGWKTKIQIGLQTFLNTLMGPKGWAKLVIAIVAAGAAMLGMEWIFKRMTGDADKQLKGLNSEFEEMQRQIRGIQGLGGRGGLVQGVLGRDFLAGSRALGPSRTNLMAIAPKIDQTNQLLRDSLARRCLK